MIFKNLQRTIIVTGGSSGIGNSLVNFLISRNFNVVNIDKKKFHIKSKNYKFIFCDLSDFKQITKRIKILNSEKNIISLINCAGMTASKESINYKLENWLKTIAVNLTAPFIISQFVAKIMIKNRSAGSIINISSISASVAMPNNPAYNASKAALSNLTKSLALDLAKYKIRVNTITPGYTNTPLNSNSWKNKKLRKKRSNKTSLQRWALPYEYNEAILFLIDKNKSSYMTGSNITIDGGWTAKGL